jgi:hypothetical protein
MINKWPLLAEKRASHNYRPWNGGEPIPSNYFLYRAYEKRDATESDEDLKRPLPPNQVDWTQELEDEDEDE